MAAAFWGALRDGLAPFALSPVKAYATFGDPEPWYAAVAAWAPGSRWQHETHRIADRPVCRLSWEPSAIAPAPRSLYRRVFRQIRTRGARVSGPPAATVVIPVHNGGRTLAAQLEALAGQAAEPVAEVLVVDNNSTDDTAAVAGSFAGVVPLLRVVTATGGASVAYARNAGWREATADKVLFCDADDVVRPGWLAAMVAALDRFDIVGGRVDVTRINTAEVQSWTGAPPTDGLAMTMRYRPHATGACMGAKRAVLDDLDGFDESFVGGHEEVDLAWRAVDRGFTLGFAEGAVVDYRLRDRPRDVFRQRFHYGRTYAQLYSRFRDAAIPRSSVRHEVKVVASFLAEAPREFRSGHGTRWLAGLAWTLGRYRGDVAYKVRCPL